MDSWVLRELIREVMHTFIVYQDDDEDDDDADKDDDSEDDFDDKDSYSD